MNIDGWYWARLGVFWGMPTRWWAAAARASCEQAGMSALPRATSTQLLPPLEGTPVKVYVASNGVHHRTTQGEPW